MRNRRRPLPQFSFRAGLVRHAPAGARSSGALMRGLAMLLIVGLFGVGCATTARDPMALTAGAPATDAQNAAADAYYAASSVAQLRAAVAQAEAAGRSWLFHELAADLAFLEGRDGARFDHLVAALSDTGNDAALLHLHQLWSFGWTFAQYERALSLYEGLVASHPDPVVRAAAAHYGAALYAQTGPTDEAARMRGQIDGLLQPLVAGAWENDQGKAFDETLPPEKNPDPEATYPGALVEVSWRAAPARSDGALDLHSLMTPDQWAVAYALADVEAPAGAGEIRLMTADPVKVWLNGTLVGSIRRLDADSFDNVVIPVTFTGGVNRILVKSAQRRAQWSLMVRVTGASGAPLAVRQVPARKASALALDAAPHDTRMGWPAVTTGPVRAAWMAALAARHLRGGQNAVEAAEAFVGAHAGSILGQFRLGGALWTAGQRGRAADRLAAVDEEAGDALPRLRVAHALFRNQSRLRREARKTFAAVKAAHPEMPKAWLALASALGSERWTAEQCQVLEEALTRFPDDVRVLMAHGDCLRRQQLDARAEAIFERVLEGVPFEPSALRRLADLALDRRDYARAIDLTEQYQRSEPAQLWPYFQRAEAQRRAGDRAAADRTLDASLRLDPDHPNTWRQRGELASQAGQQEQALAFLRGALRRNPDDGALKARLAWLSPSNDTWLKDVPDADRLAAAVTRASAIVPLPGADITVLLDHTVCELASDGSTACVVTNVQTAHNESGRDRLTLQQLGGGKVRVLAAYSVDEQGRRTEASSVKSEGVRFRGLAPGSAVVVQVRIDSPPVGYLQRHLQREWFFQSLRATNLESQFILWMPTDRHLNEECVVTDCSAVVERSDTIVEGERRISWLARNRPPLIPEPGAPSPLEIAEQLVISTVPDWGTFVAWEDELILDAIQPSAELEALAKSLIKGASTKQERLYRIHRYVMQEIRYQQDYENHIAGVKPHAAPLVAKRAYGDCKDKSVLFMTLGKLAGIDVDFALIRTRNFGPVRRAVPMQQFNHAIVYVPAQEGLAEGRFFDPTADALDLEALRPDDQGTVSLVFDPETRSHQWIEVPVQPAAINEVVFETTLSPAAPVKGTPLEDWAVAHATLGALTIRLRGQLASILRRAARNSRMVGQLASNLLNALVPGASVGEPRLIEVTDLEKPAEMAVDFETKLKRSGDATRVSFPILRSTRTWSLTERHLPLVFDYPQTQRHVVTVNVPRGVKVAELPREASLKAPCLSFTRRVKRSRRQVVVTTEATLSCIRIELEAYAEHRRIWQEAGRFLADELVLR